MAALRGAAAITVRDHGSSRLLSDLGVEHRLLPDAVHALGVLDPVERDPTRRDARSCRSRARGCACSGHARVARALARSPQLARRPVRLLPAGTATGHDSIRDYEAVARAARGLDVEILRERRPLALVDHIRRARVVIGTSLHVRIVAAAYGVPRVSLAKPKPTRYARLWDPGMPFGVALGELDAAVEAALARAARPEAAEHAERLALTAHENLEQLARRVVS